MTRRLHRGLAAVYVLAVTAALGFGSKEATATATPAENAALVCTYPECNLDCADRGYDYGTCTQYGCQCQIRMCGSVPC